MGQKPFLSIGAQATWGRDPRRAERLPVLGSPFVSPVWCICSWSGCPPGVSAPVCVCTRVFTHALEVEWACWNPSEVLLPLFCVSTSSSARGVCGSCCSFLSMSLYPSPGAPYPKPLPLSSLLPEASSQNEECGLVRPLQANLGLGTLFPSPTQGSRSPHQRGNHSGSSEGLLCLRKPSAADMVACDTRGLLPVVCPTVERGGRRSLVRASLETHHLRDQGCPAGLCLGAGI